MWAISKVTEGEVDFRMATSPLLEVRLAAGSQQSIPPRVPHEVLFIGPLRLSVGFWGRQK